MKYLQNTLKNTREGRPPWWIRCPVMIAQALTLPIGLPILFLSRIPSQGIQEAVAEMVEHIREIPDGFRECWTGRRRLW